MAAPRFQLPNFAVVPIATITVEADPDRDEIANFRTQVATWSATALAHLTVISPTHGFGQRASLVWLVIVPMRKLCPPSMPLTPILLLLLHHYEMSQTSHSLHARPSWLGLMINLCVLPDPVGGGNGEQVVKQEVEGNDLEGIEPHSLILSLPWLQFHNPTIN
jgi:hypothetical protein